jgi:hypothetical protein
MALEKLKINPQDSKIKPGRIHKLKTIKRAMKSDCSDHRHDTKILNTCIEILNTTNIICGENCESACVHVKFINQSL